LAERERGRDKKRKAREEEEEQVLFAIFVCLFVVSFFFSFFDKFSLFCFSFRVKSNKKTAAATRMMSFFESGE
jgi:hypothetical protein